MFVVSCCIAVAFHPDLNIPRLFICRSYDQDRSKLTSLIHFETVQSNFFDFKENFNMKTLYQLQNAALAVENREENTSLAETFSIELKFTVDCLKFWFERNRKVLEISEHQRIQFTKNNVKTTCCICDFPIQSRAEKGWFEHVCKAEYMFLENVFGSKDLYQMKIPNFETYFDKVKKILDNVNDFCTSIDSENRISIVEEQPNPKLDEIIIKIKKIKITKADKNDKEAPKQKAIGFYISNQSSFYPTIKYLAIFQCQIIFCRICFLFTTIKLPFIILT